MKQFRGGLVCEAHRLLYLSTLGCCSWVNKSGLRQKRDHRHLAPLRPPRRVLDASTQRQPTSIATGSKIRFVKQLGVVQIWKRAGVSIGTKKSRPPSLTIYCTRTSRLTNLIPGPLTINLYKSQSSQLYIQESLEGVFPRLGSAPASVSTALYGNELLNESNARPCYYQCGGGV